MLFEKKSIRPFAASIALAAMTFSTNAFGNEDPIQTNDNSVAIHRKEKATPGEIAFRVFGLTALIFVSAAGYAINAISKHVD